MFYFQILVFKGKFLYKCKIFNCFKLFLAETIFFQVKHKDATVLDLKKAIQRHITWKLNRQKMKVKISWKYIWRTYSLRYDSERMSKDEALLHEVGVKNKSKVTFVKRLRHKGAPE